MIGKKLEAPDLSCESFQIQQVTPNREGSIKMSLSVLGSPVVALTEQLSPASVNVNVPLLEAGPVGSGSKRREMH